MANSNYRPSGLSAFAANFERNMAAPLDATMLVKGYENLTNADTFLAQNGTNYSFAGMFVGVYGSAVADNDGVYFLTALPTTTTANWKKLASTDEITGIEGEFYTKGQIDSLLSTVNQTISDLNAAAMKKADNLSDVADVATARTNLGVYSTTQVDTAVSNALTEAKSYTDSKFSTALSYQVVESLPDTGEANVIYLVPRTEPGDQNVYDEYMWENNAWEKIGNTEVDLTGYIKTGDSATLGNLTVNNGGAVSVTDGDDTTTITTAIVTTGTVSVSSGVTIKGKNILTVDDTSLGTSTTAVPSSKAVNDALSTTASAIQTQVDSLQDLIDTNTASITTLTNDKQNKAISLEGITANTVEAAILELKGGIDTNATNIASNTSALGNKQNSAIPDSLTTAKTVEGAINELKTAVDGKADADDIAADLNGKADASAANLTSENVVSWKAKLQFITAEDEVQPDWTAASGKAQILNKPDVETDAGVVVVGGNSQKVALGLWHTDTYTANDTTPATIPYVSGHMKLHIVSGNNVADCDIVTNATTDEAMVEVIAGTNPVTSIDKTDSTLTVSVSASATIAVTYMS